MNKKELQLISNLKVLESDSENLNPTKEDRKLLLFEINTYADNFRESLESIDAYVNKFNENLNDSFSLKINDEPNSVEDALKTLEEKVDKPGLNSVSPRHFGYIPGGGVYTAALGDFLAANFNKYSGVSFASPGAVQLENTLVSWVAEEIVGYKKKYAGVHTSGGSMGNLIAISTASYAKKLSIKSSPKIGVYVTEYTHHSIIKAVRILNLDNVVIRNIKVLDNQEMFVDDLKDKLKWDKENNIYPFLIIATVGTTDTGAIDPIDEISKLAKEYKAWLHIDAAYGGFFALSTSGRKKVKFLNRGDSVVLDPHKGLFMPYGSGFVIVKNKKYLLGLNSQEANYMRERETTNGTVSPADLSPELSRHFRGLRLWLPLKIHGLKSFRFSLEEKLILAQYFYLKIRGLGFSTLCEPELSIVVFWMDKGDSSNNFNQNLVDAIHNDGRFFISSTKIKNQIVLRFAVLSFNSHVKHVDEFITFLSKMVLKIN